MFFRGSRYETVPEAEHVAPDGRTIRHKRRRVIPRTPAPLGIVVRAGDRPDLVSWRALGDPELYWMLCDANLAPRAADLTGTPGRTIGVPGPESAGR